MKYGEKLKIEIFGASHSEVIGVTVTGFPAGEKLRWDDILAFMKRRAPGGSELSTPRREDDCPIVQSGMEGCVTTGEKIVCVIRNTDRKSADYERLRYTPRPSHADYGAYLKYGEAYDNTGGGAFSGRMTAPLCFAGALCLQYLENRGVTVRAKISMIGGVYDCEGWDFSDAAFPVASSEAAARMRAAILAAKEDGDSVGGCVTCRVDNMIPGVGGPMFEGAESRIACAVFGIPAVRGIEFGAGFASAALRGSENNDEFIIKDGRITVKTNNSGGILGGICTGEPVIFTVAFKPTPSVSREQNTVDLRTGTQTKICIGGRHDPCIVQRAVPCVEAACAVALVDMLI